jgi:hypothetical protein
MIQLKAAVLDRMFFHFNNEPFTCTLVYRNRKVQLEPIQLKMTKPTAQGALNLSLVWLALCSAAALKAMVAQRQEFDTVSAHMRLCASQTRVKALYILEPIIEF